MNCSCYMRLAGLGVFLAKPFGLPLAGSMCGQLVP